MNAKACHWETGKVMRTCLRCKSEDLLGLVSSMRRVCRCGKRFVMQKIGCSACALRLFLFEVEW